MSSTSAKLKSKCHVPGHQIHDILDRLKSQYLPDLRKLRDECTWLQSSLGLEEKDATEMQTSETRLVQFVEMVDLVINKIVQLQNEDPRNVNYSKLDFLEANIVKSILPVRARLHEKWKENERSRAVQQGNMAHKVSQPMPGVGAQSDISAHSRVPAISAVDSSSTSGAGSSSRTSKLSASRSQHSSSSSAAGSHLGSTTGSSASGNVAAAAVSSNTNSNKPVSSRAGSTGRSAAVPDFAPARAASTTSTSSSSSAFGRGANAVYWAPPGDSGGADAAPVSYVPQGTLTGSFLGAVGKNPKISPISRGLLRAGVPTADVVNTAPSAHIGLSAPHHSVLSVSSGPDGQVTYSAGSNYSGFRGVKSRPGTASNQSLRVSMMGALPFSPPSSNNSDAGRAKKSLHRSASNSSLRAVQPARAQRDISGTASVASSASGGNANARSLSALHLSGATTSGRARAGDDMDTSSQQSDNHTSYSRANLASNAAALAVGMDVSPDTAAARRKHAAGAAFREAQWAAGELDEEVHEGVEDDALTASIFDDGCDSISDFGIYDHVHNADEFDPILSRRGDSLSTVPAGWRLHNEMSRAPDAKLSGTSSRSLKRPLGAVIPNLQSAYLTGGTNPTKSHHRRGEGARPSRTHSGASLALRDDGAMTRTGMGMGMSDSGDQGSLAGSATEEGEMSARRRRKLSVIVPYPRRPRTADYHCSVCCEPYQMMVTENPWWAVYTHRCPQCQMLQVPRIDITAPSNAVELDPNVAALYGDGLSDSSDSAYSSDEEGGEEAGEAGDDVPILGANARDQEMGRTGRSSEHMTAEDEHRGKTPRRRGQSAEDAAEYSGAAAASTRSSHAPVDPAAADAQRAADALDREEQSKLLVLMCHARTCTGTHSSDKHAEICKSTKYLMLHIRDCRGLDAQGQECAFPWCRPCKKMLKHLTQCFQPSTCSICSPWGLPPPYQQLRQLQQIPFCPPSSAPGSAGVQDTAPAPAQARRT